MPIGEILAIAMIVATIPAILLGYPVAFTLAGLSLFFAGFGQAAGVFDPALLLGLASRYYDVMTREVFVAVPLFVFMGMMLERSKSAEALLDTAGKLFGGLRGGLGISVVLVGAMLAASTGVIGATVVTMGLLSLPAMLRAGYDPRLATGIVCASGTLGQIIPPSTVLIFLADMLQNANQAAQQSIGNFAPEPLSVGQLFAGALLPGFTLVLLYLLWIGGVALFRPSAAPARQLTAGERARLGRDVAGAMLPPLVLILAVLGSILGGFATATESASVGAVGAIILSALRGRLTLAILRDALHQTVQISAMVFVVLLGASVYSVVFRGLGGEAIVTDVLSNMPGGAVAATAAVMAVIFVLGFFLDTFEIIFIVVPITAPVLLALGVDPLWLGILISVNLQTSFLTPPFGFALFYLRGAADRSVPTTVIWRGAMPFVALQLIGLGLIWLVPEIATWLPGVLFPSTASGGGEGVSLDQFMAPPTAPLPSTSLDTLFGP